VLPGSPEGNLPGGSGDAHAEDIPGRKNLLPLRRFLGITPDLLLNRRIADAIPGEIDVLNVHEHFVYPAAVYWKSRTKKPIVWMMNDVPGEFFPHWDRRRPWQKFDRVVNGKEWENRIRRAMARRFDEILVLSGIEGTRLREQTGLEGRVIRADRTPGISLPSRHPPDLGRSACSPTPSSSPPATGRHFAALQILGTGELISSGSTQDTEGPGVFPEISACCDRGIAGPDHFPGERERAELVGSSSVPMRSSFRTPAILGLPFSMRWRADTGDRVPRRGASGVLTHGRTRSSWTLSPRLRSRTPWSS
jgi:hypothetical protein